ncbi:CmpA/NrtA family ABC transporter substrate-binding protein [Consotaella aegiceratis]|uniref:CmpA/NrtA family ABC transporter substrate-binding protein n=1 Tax=Consotaella aegiceratis TaxID=3097961 RepID=UPI002F40CEFB
MKPIEIRAGYIPLLDCALLVVAAEQGFAAEEGLELRLVRETSWANIRDRMGVGHFDVAHMLAPMPIAATLGLAPLPTPMLAPIALGRGGNTVTVSTGLFREMREQGFDREGPREAGASLRHVIAARRAGGGDLLRFGVVHPHSSHNYDLRYWLAASGIDPATEIEITVIPPPFMADALAAGHIDGFCAGEPWGTVAVAAGAGRIVTTKAEIWPRSPEKVLGVSERFAAEHPDAVAGLVRALAHAASWCDEPANHPVLIDLLGAASRLDVDASLLRPALTGDLMIEPDRVRHVEEFVVFGRHGANRPEPRHAGWLFSQMARWGDATMSDDSRRRAIAVFRPDIFESALQKSPIASLLAAPIAPAQDPGEPDDLFDR